MEAAAIRLFYDEFSLFFQKQLKKNIEKPLSIVKFLHDLSLCMDQPQNV
jgi:hypothetical protein